MSAADKANAAMDLDWLRRWAEQRRDEADEQMSALPQWAEFWRGRRGAYIDLLAELNRGPS